MLADRIQQNYIYHKVVGEGSFGKALLCSRRLDKKECIIKQISLSKMSKSESKRTEQESTLLARLNHPNIVSFWESFTNQGNLYIVMEYANGGDVDKFLKSRNGRLLSEDKVLHVFIQISLAIKHIHDRKILHRDLKSQNIFLTQDGMIKLGDFGIARVLRNTSELASTQIGTPYYMPPEIMDNKKYNSKADIWSLGVVLYELLCLKLPFQGSNMRQLVVNIMRVDPPPPPNIFSTAISDLLRSLMNKNPKLRPAIGPVLAAPVVRSRISIFLDDAQLKREFSHTVIHGADILASPIAAAALPSRPAEETPKQVPADDVSKAAPVVPPAVKAAHPKLAAQPKPVVSRYAQPRAAEPRRPLRAPGVKPPLPSRDGKESKLRIESRRAVGAVEPVVKQIEPVVKQREAVGAVKQAEWGGRLKNAAEAKTDDGHNDNSAVGHQEKKEKDCLSSEASGESVGDVWLSSIELRMQELKREAKQVSRSSPKSERKQPASKAIISPEFLSQLEAQMGGIKSEMEHLKMLSPRLCPAPSRPKTADASPGLSHPTPVSKGRTPVIVMSKQKPISVSVDKETLMKRRQQREIESKALREYVKAQRASNPALLKNEKKMKKSPPTSAVKSAVNGKIAEKDMKEKLLKVVDEEVKITKEKRDYEKERQALRARIVEQRRVVQPQKVAVRVYAPGAVLENSFNSEEDKKLATHNKSLSSRDDIDIRVSSAMVSDGAASKSADDSMLRSRPMSSGLNSTNETAVWIKPKQTFSEDSSLNEESGKPGHDLDAVDSAFVDAVMSMRRSSMDAAVEYLQKMSGLLFRRNSRIQPELSSMNPQPKEIIGIGKISGDEGSVNSSEDDEAFGSVDNETNNDDYYDDEEYSEYKDELYQQDGMVPDELIKPQNSSSLLDFSLMLEDMQRVIDLPAHDEPEDNDVIEYSSPKAENDRYRSDKVDIYAPVVDLDMGIGRNASCDRLNLTAFIKESQASPDKQKTKLSQIRRLRVYLDLRLGKDRFETAYRFLRLSDVLTIDEDTLLTELERILGLDGLKYLDDLFTLIALEQ